MKKILFAVLFFYINDSMLLSQEEDLLAMVEEDKAPGKEFVSATFKGTRLISLHTIETPGKNSLEFRISHRFGDFNSGGYNFWGLDGGASIRMGFDYSVTDRLVVGIGRSSLEKMFDGSLKYKLIAQGKNGGAPVTVTLFSGMYYTTLKDPNAQTGGGNRYEFESSRFSYCHQVMVARKFSDRFSLQLTPALVHYNLVDFVAEPNDLLIAGVAGRYMLTKRMGLTFEYAYRINDRVSGRYFDCAAVGIDLETGGHVFQMYLTNSAGMAEPQFFGRTNSDVREWAIKLGFNISRMFAINSR